jgi:hypothetical protein
MKYLSKLSNRMAQMHAPIGVGLLLLLAGCNLNLQEPISYDALNPPDETIPLPETTRTCDNEPAGFTRAIDAPMNVLPALTPNVSAEGMVHWPNQIRTLFIEQSSSAPISPGSVLRVVYLRGQNGGESPSRWGTRSLPANTGSLYVCAWVRFMPGWSSNGNAGTKFFATRGPAGTNHVVGFDAGADHSHNYVYSTPQFNDINFSYNLGQVATPENDIAGGGWHKIEVLWEANTPGQRDGGYRHWVDGRLIAAATDAWYFLAGQTPRWDSIWFDPTFGGGVNTVPFDQFWEMDHFVASVR